MTGARRTGGELCRCRFVPHHVTRENCNNDTAASAHDRRHDRSWLVRQHHKASYLKSVIGLARHYGRSPEKISAREVQDYLIHLHQHRG